MSNGELGGIVPPNLVNTGGQNPLTDLLKELSGLELQYTQTKKSVPENNPSLIALVDGINKLKPGILDNIGSQRKNLIAARSDLEGNNSNYASMLKAVPEKERELLNISRQQAIKNDIYTFLLQKREETELSFASAVADSRIIDEADSSSVPFSPKRSLTYLIVVIASMALGIGLISIMEILTLTIQQKSDIEKYLTTPILGDVMYDRSKLPIVISEGKRS